MAKKKPISPEKARWNHKADLIIEQLDAVEKLEKAYMQACTDGDEWAAYKILQFELPAAKSLARLIHK